MLGSRCFVLAYTEKSNQTKTKFKKMKKVILVTTTTLTLLICMVFNSSAQVIGKIVNNIPTLTVDKPQLIKGYTNNLNANSQLNASFNNVEVVSSEENFYLIFRGDNIRSTLMVTKVLGSDGIYFLMAEGKTSCTTTDCSHEATGCVPNWLSKACDPCNNKGKCSRTTTSKSMIPNLSY